MTVDRKETTRRVLAKELDKLSELEIMQLHEKFNELRDSSLADLMHLQQQQTEMLNRLVSADRARRH